MGGSLRIFQPLVSFGGNLPPQLAITRELVNRGHRVRVGAHRVIRARVEAAGADLVEYRGWHDDLDLTRPETDPIRDWAAKTQLGSAKRMWGAVIDSLPILARFCMAEIEREGADVIVLDCLLNGAVAVAERAGVPAVALAHCPYPLPVDGAPPLFSGLAPMGGPLGRTRDRIFNAITARVNASGLPTLNETRRELGLAPLAHWEDQLKAANAIYMLTAPELDFSSRAALPAHVHYMGPSFEPFGTEWESPWPASNTDPLVVVSMSTTYMNQIAMTQRVLDALAPLRVRALLTAGPAIDTRQLRLSANARSVGYVPHRTVMPHASLVITHAGWQTVNAALADGVPLVCLPDGRDQPDNAARVVAIGAGVRARKTTAPEKLRAIVERALANPTLKQRAQEMASALARRNGTTATADAIEQLC